MNNQSSSSSSIVLVIEAKGRIFDANFVPAAPRTMDEEENDDEIHRNTHA